MRASVMTVIRLGPCAVYGAAALSLVSVALVANAPSSALAWGVYMTMVPSTRRLVLALVSAPGPAFWGAVAMLIVGAAVGAYLALRPERYLRLRFVHAHVALIASGLAVIQISGNGAGLASASFSQLPASSWSVVLSSPTGLVLLVLVFLACLNAHAAIIKRIRV